MTSKSLQTPTILEIIGSTIRIKNPDISGYVRTEMTVPLTAGGTALTVADNNKFVDDDWFIIGETGDAKTEECDVNGAVTRGTSITITNTTKFSHEIHAPVTRVFERGVKIFGAATNGGAGTLIASIDAVTTPIADAVMLQWDKPYTEFTLTTTDTAYAYYYAVFCDATTSSSASDYVASTGLINTGAYKLVNAGLSAAGAEVDGSKITWEWLLDVVNDWQDEVCHHVTADGTSKDWSFEEEEDKTSITVTQNEYRYDLSNLTNDLKYGKTNQSIIQVKLGENILKYESLTDLEEDYNGSKSTAVATQASAAATSLILDDTYEFSESGSIYAGSQLLTYTTNTELTATLSGIPASGTGSIASTITVDTIVWQGVNPGVADKYSVYNGQILLNSPVDSDTVGRKLKIKYFKTTARLGSLSDDTTIPYTYTARDYIAHRIEDKKGNDARSASFLSRFQASLEKIAQNDRSETVETTDYYNFDDGQTFDNDDD